MKFTREKIKALITQFDPSILNVGLSKLLSQRGIPLYSQLPSWEAHNVVSVHRFIYNTLTTDLLNLVDESIEEEQFITLLAEACQTINAGPKCGATFDYHISLDGVGEYVRDTILFTENVEKKLVNDLPSLSLAPILADLKHATEILDSALTSKATEFTLQMAAKKGHSAIVLALIMQDADVQARNTEGETALHLAAKNGHSNTIAILISKGKADIKATTSYYNGYQETALHLAAKNGHIASVACLINKGANVNESNKYGETALHLAARNGHIACVIHLIENGADVRAVNLSYHQRLEGFLHEQQDTNSETPLHLAATNGHTGCVTHLIIKGADVHAITAAGDTALHLAAKNGHTICVSALIEKGSDVHAINNRYRETALHRAAANGHSATIAILIGAGADVNVSSEAGTALHSAAFFGHEDAVNILIRLGADVHAVDTMRRETALMRAAGKGHTAIVSALIKNGASVNHANRNSNTPLMKASAGGHTSTVAILCEHGADLNAVDEDGKTSLMYATTCGDHPNVISTLIIHGARTDMVNLFGATALSSAQTRERFNAVTMLMQRTVLDTLQRTCQRRDEAVGMMIVYRIFAGMPFDLARRISSFDSDPSLEYLSQNTLMRLKEGVTKRQTPLPAANNNAIASTKKVFKIGC